MKCLIHSILFGMILLQSLIPEALGQDQVSVFGKKDLTTTQISCSFVDSYGIVWLGSANGLNAYLEDGWIQIKNITDSESGRAISIREVYFIREDKNRNIWVSSEGGLFRFNRQYWEHFKDPMVEGFRTRHFLEDRQGRIWATFEGEEVIDAVGMRGFMKIYGTIQMFDGEHWYAFFSEVAGNKTVEYGEATAYYSGLIEDRDGKIWIGSISGVFAFEEAGWVNYRDSIPTQQTTTLLNDRKGRVWVGTNKGIGMHESGHWSLYTRKEGLDGNVVHEITEDPDGKIWVFSGIDARPTYISYYEDGDWETFSKEDLNLSSVEGEMYFIRGASVFITNTTAVLFSDYSILTLIPTDSGWENIMAHRDLRGRLWLAGNNGVGRVVDNTFVDVHAFSPEEEIEITYCMMDQKRQLWMGTKSSGLLLRKNDEWLSYSGKQYLADDEVTEIFTDKNKRIWVLNRKGISCFILE